MQQSHYWLWLLVLAVCTDLHLFACQMLSLHWSDRFIMSADTGLFWLGAVVCVGVPSSEKVLKGMHCSDEREDVTWDKHQQTTKFRPGSYSSTFSITRHVVPFSLHPVTHKYCILSSQVEQLHSKGKLGCSDQQCEKALKRLCKSWKNKQCRFYELQNKLLWWHKHRCSRVLSDWAIHPVPSGVLEPLIRSPINSIN